MDRSSGRKARKHQNKKLVRDTDKREYKIDGYIGSLCILAKNSWMRMKRPIQNNINQLIL